MVREKAVELVTMLKQLDIPVAYSHFKDGPGVPFVTYLFDGRDDFEADNINYHKIVEARIELYTKEPLSDVEVQIEDLLEENEITYTWSQVYIDSQDVFQTIYEMRLF